jgi:hypothetical protein
MTDESVTANNEVDGGFSNDIEDTDSGASNDDVVGDVPMAGNALPATHECPTCTRLDILLPCCLSRISSSPCATCAAFEAATAAQVPDTQTVRQDQEGRIQALKMETKQFEEQNERGSAQLDEKKKLLHEKIGQLKKFMGPNASKKVMKEVRRAGEAVVEERRWKTETESPDSVGAPEAYKAFSDYSIDDCNSLSLSSAGTRSSSSKSRRLRKHEALRSGDDDRCSSTMVERVMQR